MGVQPRDDHKICLTTSCLFRISEKKCLTFELIEHQQFSYSTVLIILLLLGCLSSKLCLTLCDPMDGRPPCSSASGVTQEGILEWIANPSPGDIPDLGIERMSPAWKVDSLTLNHLGSPLIVFTVQFQINTRYGTGYVILFKGEAYKCMSVKFLIW